MSQVVRNPQPKVRFQQTSSNVAKHRDMIQLAEFERAVDFAFLQMQSQLCTDLTDLNQCASKHLRLQGALEFVQILRNLAESVSPGLPSRAPTNLDHDEKPSLLREQLKNA